MGTAKESKTLIMSKQCPGCKLLMDALKAHGTLDNYKIVDVASSEGRKMVDRFGLTAVPECVVVVNDATGELARRCTPKEMTDIIEEAMDNGER